MSRTALTAAIRAIDPSVAQVYAATSARISAGLCAFPRFDCKENDTGNKIGKNQDPAYGGNSQVVIERTTTTTEQPDIARHNCQDRRQRKAEEPGAFMLSEPYLHRLATILIHSTLRSDACTRDNTSPSCHAPCRNRDRFHAERPGTAGRLTIPTQPFQSNPDILQKEAPQEGQACQAPYR